MTLNTKLTDYYFLILFALVPITILIGPAISLINILLITSSFLIIFFRKNIFFVFQNKTFLVLCVLYIYLIFNSLISINFEIAAERNFGFVRFIILFLAINFFFLKLKKLNFILKFWGTVILLVLFDVIFEVYNGYNTLGFVSENKKRIVSFFKDEAVVGAFINGFAFIIIGFLFKNFEKRTNIEKILIFSFIILTFLCLVFSGERSNTLKLLFGLTIFFYYNNKIKFNHKLFFLLSVLCVFIFSYIASAEIRHRYKNDIINKLSDTEKRQNYIYFKLYSSGLEVYKKNPIFGVGNKNYRVETCKISDDKNKRYICITHPHQIYIEFLSEHGIVGSLVLLVILIYLIFKNFKIMLKDNNLIQIGCFSYLLINFIPILPGGSFFADFNATFFWINLSLLYASNPNTNIFKNLKN